MQDVGFSETGPATRFYMIMYGPFKGLCSVGSIWGNMTPVIDERMERNMVNQTETGIT